MKKILIATGNAGKLKELIEAFNLNGINKNIEFLSLQDFPEIETNPEENGLTYEENALIKSRFFAEKFNIPTIGEDSGLEIEAFPGKFGIRTKREIVAKNDAEWLEKFLQLLSDKKNRAAHFFSATAFFDPETKKFITFLGSTSGAIVDTPKTDLEPGIPVSAVFKVTGHAKVFSAMTKEEKNNVSHRGKSSKKMSDYLHTLYVKDEN